MNGIKRGLDAAKGFMVRQGHWVALSVSLLLMLGAAWWVSLEPAPEVTAGATTQPDALVGQQPDFVEDLGDVLIAAQPTPLPTLPPKPAPSWLMPLAGNIASPYSPVTPLYSKTLLHWQTHPGVDILAREGDPVISPADGVVTDVDVCPALGGRVTIDHGEGVLGVYAGLLGTPPVAKGDKVLAGQTIGAVGNAPAEADIGAHLHFEVLESGKHADPLKRVTK